MPAAYRRDRTRAATVTQVTTDPLMGRPLGSSHIIIYNSETNKQKTYQSYRGVQDQGNPRGPHELPLLPEGAKGYTEKCRLVDGRCLGLTKTGYGQSLGRQCAGPPIPMRKSCYHWKGRKQSKNYIQQELSVIILQLSYKFIYFANYYVYTLYYLP